MSSSTVVTPHCGLDLHPADRVCRVDGISGLRLCGSRMEEVDDRTDGEKADAKS